MADRHPLSETRDLRHITYSREETIAAVTSYYEFLTNMYMDEDAVEHPPATGWPEITVESMRALGKTDEVVELLRHLPYIRHGDHEIQDWTHYASGGPYQHGKPCEWNWRHIPSHVIGLVDSEDFQMLLDTKLGVIYFTGSDATPGPSRINTSPYRAIRDMPQDYAPREEEDWRGSGGGRCAWAIPEFFEMLKFYFRELNYIPLGREQVEEDFDREDPDLEVQDSEPAAVFPIIRKIFQQHGWPDLTQYRKDGCIEAVEEEWENFCQRAYD